MHTGNLRISNLFKLNLSIFEKKLRLNVYIYMHIFEYPNLKSSIFRQKLLHRQTILIQPLNHLTMQKSVITNTQLTWFSEILVSGKT